MEEQEEEEEGVMVEVMEEVEEDVEVDRQTLLPFQPRLNRTVHLEEIWEVFPTNPIHS